MPLRVSCPGPVLPLFSSWWAGPVPSSSCLAWACPPPCRLPAGFARCGGGARTPRGGGRLPGCGASGVGRLATPDRPSLARAAGARYPLAAGAGGVSVETCQQPHSVCFCEVALRVGGRPEGDRGGGVSCLGVWRPGRGAHPRPTACP